MHEEDDRFAQKEDGPSAELELAYDPRERARARAPEPTRPPSLAWWLGAALVLLAVADIARVISVPLGAPREADWRAAEGKVRSQFAPGDLIVAAPDWADPMMRLYLGDLVPPEVAARPSADRFARIWEVSIRGQSASEAGQPAQCTSELDGRVRVRLCQKPAEKIDYDLLVHFPQAQVSLVRDGREQACVHENDRFVCAAARPPIAVAVGIGEVDYRPYRCLLVSPALVQDDLRIVWPDVPLGHGLIVYTGIHSFYARKAAQGTVAVDVAVAGRAAGHFDHRNGDGWKRVEIPTHKEAGTRAPVRIAFSSPQPQDRKLCFRAEVLR